MKNILVIFTGGTIGSRISQGTIDTSTQSAFQLLELFRLNYPRHRQIEFQTLQPYQLLSENLSPIIWEKLISTIEAANPDQYDGIIVTHGTDTLAYTAAALSFYFHTIKLPILLVSSDYPLSDPRANGLANFICAVEFICQKIRSGVFVPYRNPGSITKVHWGSRLTCSLPLTGDFFSIKNSSFMDFADGRFSNGTLPAITAPTLEYSLQANFSSQVLMIRPYPGLNYSSVNLQTATAVLHDLYHSGTACVTRDWGREQSLLEFLQRGREQHLEIYLAPILKSENTYQSTHSLMEHGAKFIWNMSLEAAYVKLLLACGNFTDARNRHEFLNTDLAGETVA